jgi:hypothetical protein
MAISHLFNNRCVPDWLLPIVALESSKAHRTAFAMIYHLDAPPAPYDPLVHRVGVGASSSPSTAFDRRLYFHTVQSRNPLNANNIWRTADDAPQHGLDPAQSAAPAAADVDAVRRPRTTVFTYEHEGVSTVAAVDTPSGKNQFLDGRRHKAGQPSGVETDLRVSITSICVRRRRRRHQTAIFMFVGTTQGGAAVLSPP